MLYAMKILMKVSDLKDRLASHGEEIKYITDESIGTKIVFFCKLDFNDEINQKESHRASRFTVLIGDAITE